MFYSYRIKGFSFLLINFPFLFSAVLTFLRHIEVYFTFGFPDCVLLNRGFRYIEVLFHTFYSNFVRAEVYLTVASLRNRTAGRLRTAEWRKNVVRDCAFPMLRDMFSSFCCPES